ncbi:MAG: cysteine desulfurase [Chitinophagaceae bacterium]|nr:cysteine desulfurase [Chitinophagaceae bacterium]
MEATVEVTKEFDVHEIRQRFPVLTRIVNKKPLIYFDNAATAQKPDVVIDALDYYYKKYNANIHRGIHALAEEATSAYEATRTAVHKFLNSKFREEIIFTSGTTESINLVAYTWARKNIKKGDEIIVSTMEHHSNIVPWQLVCEEKGARLKVIPVNDRGELDMEAYKSLLSEKTKIVSVAHVSNVLGTINPVKEIVKYAHEAGAITLIDGAQSTVHLNIDVQDIDCDFFAFSAHKVYGPGGVGVLYGKKKILEEMPVFKGGGEMISEVTFEKTTYNELPYKFEAGTPNVGDVIVFKRSLEFLEKTGRKNIHKYEQELLKYATGAFKEIEGLRIIGTAKNKTGVISFLLDKIHPQDIGVLLDQQGIAVRTGHHCAQPLMDRFGIKGTARASFAMYNTREEVDRFVVALRKAKKMLQ